MTDVGYRRPPATTRFTKGTSGNPSGRPRGRHNRPPYDAVLGQKVVLRDAGVERTATAAEAFLLYLTKRGLEGDGAAARSVAAVIEEARAQRVMSGPGGKAPSSITVAFIGVGNVNSALWTLGMATKLDRFRPSARMALEPWLVEAALARLGDRRLSSEEQAEIVAATRTPRKVKWPDWWKHKP